MREIYVDGQIPDGSVKRPFHTLGEALGSLEVELSLWSKVKRRLKGERGAVYKIASINVINKENHA